MMSLELMFLTHIRNNKREFYDKSIAYNHKREPAKKKSESIKYRKH